MGFIIVWRQGLQRPHVNTDAVEFLEVYDTYEDAVKEAEEMHDGDSCCDYAIYKEVKHHEGMRESNP